MPTWAGSPGWSTFEPGSLAARSEQRSDAVPTSRTRAIVSRSSSGFFVVPRATNITHLIFPGQSRTGDLVSDVCADDTRSARPEPCVLRLADSIIDPRDEVEAGRSFFAPGGPSKERHRGITIPPERTVFLGRCLLCGSRLVWRKADELGQRNYPNRGIARLRS